MSVAEQPRMDASAFLAWALNEPGRWELHYGEPVTMSPERIGHGEAKFALQKSLESAIHEAALDCSMLPDGMPVIIDDETVFEPNALVYCGTKLDRDTIGVPNPIIVVEVLSPSTEAIDRGTKFHNYFRLASIQHYLIVDPQARAITHHRRAGDEIITRMIDEGRVECDPPGLTLKLHDLWSP